MTVQRAKLTDAIPRHFRVTLARLELLSYGAITAYNSSGGRDSEHPGGNRPGSLSNANPLHVQYLEKWLKQTDDLGRRRVEDEAEEALNDVLVGGKRPDRVEDVSERNAEIIRKGKGWTMHQVADAYRLTVKEVRAIRREADVDQATGNPLPNQDVREVWEKSVERTLELRRQGVKPSQIATLQRIDRATVSRRLKKAA